VREDGFFVVLPVNKTAVTCKIAYALLHIKRHLCISFFTPLPSSWSILTLLFPGQGGNIKEKDAGEGISEMADGESILIPWLDIARPSPKPSSS